MASFDQLCNWSWLVLIAITSHVFLPLPSQYDTPTINGPQQAQQMCRRGQRHGDGVQVGNMRGEMGERRAYIVRLPFFYFFTHFVDYSTYSQLTPTNQTHPIDNPFRHDKEGCVLLAMSISHLDMTRRAASSLPPQDATKGEFPLVMSYSLRCDEVFTLLLYPVHFDAMRGHGVSYHFCLMQWEVISLLVVLNI